ncbi:MAG: flagellar filament capping protein FliD [Alicyclobacillus sp.]|nr:flagellar filament capping protein FliD [Alicyclobacillus sp.]
MTFIGSLSGASSAGGAPAGGTSSLTYTPGSGLSGLASGINTDAMVTAMVQAAQVPLVQLLQQRQILQWQEMRYQQVNVSLSTLQQSVSNLQLQSTFLAHTASSSNPSVVTATASTLAPAGTFNVTIQQLAQGATVVSSTPLSGDPSQQTVGQFNGGQGITLTLNGQSLTFQATDSLQTVLSNITSQTALGISAFYDSNTGQVVFQTTSTGSGAVMLANNQTASFLASAFHLTYPPSLTSTVNLSSGLTSSVTLEINGQKIQLNGSATNPMTLSQIEAAINNPQVQAKTGVTASDDGQGHLILNPSYTDSSGNTYQLLSPISVSESDSSNALGFQGVYSGTAAQQVAQDAVYIVNGYTTTSPSNQASFNGLTLNLLSAAPGSAATITVGVDVDTIVNSLTNFVQQYNQTLQLMQGLYNEQRNYDYLPLTSQQAAQMTQTQIDEWNQKAQSGMLAYDPLLGNTMNTLENDMQLTLQNQTSSTVNGQTVTLNSLAAIGITPIDPLNGVASGAIAPGVTTTGWNTYGLLQINTDQLRAAVQADPQAVMRLFTNNPSLPGNQNNMSTGIAVQLYNDLENQIQQFTQQAGSNPNINSEIITKLANGASAGMAGLLPYTPIDPNADFNSLFSLDPADVSFLGQQISGIDTQAEDMQQQISDLQQRYQNEFTQMEQALAQLSTQSSFLMGISSSSGSSAGG